MDVIPFNLPPQLGDRQLQAIREVVSSGHIQGTGPWGVRCEKALGEILARNVLLTSSCTHALELAALLLEIRPGDEVIVPSFAFSSTANAFALRGARIRYADIDAYGNIDLDAIGRLLHSKTRAVVPIHYGGGSCQVDRLIEQCRSVGTVVVADAAHSAGAKYLGNPLGAWCDIGTWSFHNTKNLSAGEGGCLILSQPEYLERAQFIREKGTNRANFVAGITNKYTWVDLGSSYVLSELNAALLYPQLLELERISQRRIQIWKRYEAELGPLFSKVGWDWVRIPPGCESNGHLFAFLTESQAERDRFIVEMRSLGVVTAFHYLALHRSPFGQRYADKGVNLPMTDRFSSCLVRLPLFYDLTDAQQERVIASTRKICHSIRSRYRSNVRSLNCAAPSAV